MTHSAIASEDPMEGIRNPPIAQKSGILVTLLHCILFFSNIILRLFNIRFIRLQNDTLFNYVISVHVNKSESMSPLTEFGNVDLMAWNGHILCAGETQYVSIAVFFTSMIRLSGVDIYIPSISFWDPFSLPTIRLSESLHLPPVAASVSPPASPSPSAKRDVNGWTSISPSPSSSNLQPPDVEAVSPSKMKINCRLTFTVEGNLQIVVVKPLLTRFYENQSVLQNLSIKELMRQELLKNGNSELLILQLKEDILFGENNNNSKASNNANHKQNTSSFKDETPNVSPAQPTTTIASQYDVDADGNVIKSASSFLPKKPLDDEENLALTKELLEKRKQKREEFFNQIRLMTYYEPWDEIYRVKDANQKDLCETPYGGEVYQYLNQIDNDTKTHDHLLIVHGKSNQRMCSIDVDPISYAMLFYFYMLILFKDIDEDIQNDSETYIKASAKKDGTKQPSSQDNPLITPSVTSDRNRRQSTIFGGTVSKSKKQSQQLSYEEMQGIDIESLMKLYIIKNEGGLIKYITIRLMNAYNEYIILILTLVTGDYAPHVMFLIIINVLVVGFANASRPAVSLHCGKKWYGSGNQWDEKQQLQVGNNYTNNLLSYFVSLCMSALTQLTLTDPKQDILELLVWSIAQVYLGLMSFSIVCIIGSVSNTRLGLAFPPPYNKHPVVKGICMLLAMCIPVLINVMITFMPFDVTCYVMGSLQIIFVMGLRFHREPHQFANAFFYSTISEACKIFLQIITYFMYVFHPGRLQQIIESLVRTYQHNLNDLLMAFMALLFFGGSILYAQLYQ